MDARPTNALLVFVDFTDTTLNAVATAGVLSKQLKTNLHLVYVLSPGEAQTVIDDEPVSAASTSGPAGEALARVQQLATTINQEQLISCTASYREGIVHEEVVAEALTVRAGLLVMGIHVGANMQAFRTSNDAYQVITKTACPVLTVPDTQRWTTFARILFPVRPIPDALDKYAFARNIIRQKGATLTVLALAAPHEIVSQEQVQEELAQLTVKLTQDDIHSQMVFCTTDSMAETVLDQAAALQSDLVIITAQLATSSDNFLIGPFTQQIIHTAPLPVLSIRPEFAINPNSARVIWQNDRTDSGLDFLGL